MGSGVCSRKDRVMSWRYEGKEWTSLDRCKSGTDVKLLWATPLGPYEPERVYRLSDDGRWKFAGGDGTEWFEERMPEWVLMYWRPAI